MYSSLLLCLSLPPSLPLSPDVASSQGYWYSPPSNDTPSLRKYHVATR